MMNNKFIIKLNSNFKRKLMKLKEQAIKALALKS